MNVYHNIGFPLKAKRQDLNKPQRDDMIRRAADMVSIGHLLDRRPRHLSGGERQRVAIARALVTEPMVLLLDEPLSNLDAKLRAAARDELKDFQRRLGITTIFVTHDQVEAMGLGDRIVVMSEGKVQQIGTPQAIYDDPDNVFVATFLGSPGMNLLPADGHMLGFRPEHFLPASRMNHQNGGMNLTYHVKRVEYLGSDRLLYGYVENFPETRLTLSKLPMYVDNPIEVGTSYEFAVQKPAIKYFDNQNGQRLAEGHDG
jgi:multiple sugar transport system ATP-binding protein